MTSKEMADIAEQQLCRYLDLCAQLRQRVGPAIAVLRDLGHKSTAAPLEEILFQMDALAQEASAALERFGSHDFAQRFKQES